MFAFVVYAVIAWYVAAKHRRTWKGYASVGVAFAGLVVVAALHWQLNIWTDGRIYIRVMQILLYPYTVVVAAVGLYIASLPRAIAVGACHRCGYDLAGLPIRDQCCPECGVAVAVAAVRGCCAVCREELAPARSRFGQCAACRTPYRLETRARRATRRRVSVTAPVAKPTARPRSAVRPRNRPPLVIERVAFFGSSTAAV